MSLSAEPRFSQITFLHGRDELPSGSVERLEAALLKAYPALTCARPFVPSDTDAAEALAFVKRNYVSRMRQDSLLVGLGRGGLIACAVQDAFPALRLSVFAANAPTEEDGVSAKPSEERVALYSSSKPYLAGRCGWEALTPMAYDKPWMALGENLYALAYLISAFSHGADMDKQVAMMFPA